MTAINGKLAVVTGGSQGIGLHIAKHLILRGGSVAIVSRSLDKLDKARETLGKNAFSFSADLSDVEDTRRTMDAIKAALGRVDILVNNAGSGTFGPISNQSAKDVEAPISLPLSAALAATHAVIPNMIENQGGHIVNLTSPAGYVPFPNMAPYVASRHAMLGFSLALSGELSRHGIGVTSFCPAQVDTEYFQHNGADIRWYPKVSRFFPVLTPDQVGHQVVKAIEQNKREVIYPLALTLIVKAYRMFPRASESLLKACGMWEPQSGAGKD